MKKLVLTGLLVLSTMAFAAKITTTGKSWEKIEKENKVPEQEISIMNFSWLDKKDGVEGVYNTYSFKIGKLESDKNNNFYLSSYYDEKPENGLPDAPLLCACSPGCNTPSNTSGRPETAVSKRSRRNAVPEIST